MTPVCWKADYTFTGTEAGAVTVTPDPVGLSYYYTSQAEMSRILSPDVASALVEDYSDAPSILNIWNEIREEATDLVNYYLAMWYEESDMATSSWVRRNATWLGCYLVSQRRGDPGKYHSRAEEIVAMLEQVSLGRKQVPRLPTKADLTPSLSNYTVDDRFHLAKIRVIPSISTGGTSGKQHLDARFPQEWFR